MKRFLTISTLLATVSISCAGDSLEGLFNKAVQSAKKVCGVKSFSKGLKAVKLCVNSKLYTEAQAIDDCKAVFGNREGLNAFKQCMEAKKFIYAESWRGSCLLTELGANKDVASYLQRPAEDVTFENLEPIITNKYERAFYEDGPYASYRKSIKPSSDRSFYTTGTDYKAELVLTSQLKEKFKGQNHIVIDGIDGNCSGDDCRKDIYDTRMYINKLRAYPKTK